jgi:thioredoxin reductase (NADPH)
MDYDVIIVGGACAGTSAAIYAVRRALKTLIISKDVGGQIATTELVENYPGYDTISGLDLATKFKDQAIKFGAEWKFDTAKDLKQIDGGFEIKTKQRTYTTKAVILAFGKTPRTLDILGEKEFMGKGVVFCATCDGPLFKDRTIAVVGGGNSAFTAAEYMSKLAKKVYLIHRNEEFKAEKVLVDKVKSDPKIEIRLNSKVNKIEGKHLVESIDLENTKDKKIEKLKLDGVFIEIGFKVQADFLEGMVKFDAFGQVIVNEKCETGTPGLYAAGDLTNVVYKQAIISAGQGATAGLAVYEYVSDGDRDRPLGSDWSYGA